MRRLWLGLCAASAALWAQSASVSGRVDNASGAAVGGARITAENTSTGYKSTSTSDRNGLYAFPLLSPGIYRMTAEKEGFRKLERPLTLSVDESATMDLSLQPGAGEELSQGPAKGTFGTTTSGTIKNIVDSQRTRETPLNGRDVLQLVALTPGAVAVSSGAQGSRGSLSHGSSYSVNGGRGTQTNYYVDGADGTDFSIKGPAATPHPDAVEEISVQSNSYSAAYGGGAGAVVNVVTRGGTNQLRGSVFEFFRNDALDARAPVALDKQKLRYSQFGYTLGGPVVWPGLYSGRNRTFFFTSYQGTQNHQTQPQSTVVPSLAERSGDFSALMTALRDPDTKQPIPNKLIPASRMSPAALAFQSKLLPEPNAGAKLYTFNQIRPQDADFFQTRLDHLLSAGNRLSGRYSFQESNQIQSTNLPVTIRTKNSHDHSFFVTGTHSFTPSVVNSLTVSYLKVDFQSLPAKVFSWSDVGVRLPRADPAAIPAADLRVTGYFGRVWGGQEQEEPRRSLRVTDTLNWVAGRHQWKLGGNLQRQSYGVREATLTDGAVSFQARLSGDNYADLLLGRPSEVQQQTAQARGFHRWSPSFFLQDDFRVSRTLALNAGLRYEPYFPFTESSDRMGGFVAGLLSTRFSSAPAGAVFSGDGSVPRGFLRNRLKVLSPRLGFAWSPKEGSRTVFRAGYGIFYDQPRAIVLTDLLSPFQPWGLNGRFTDVQGFDNPYLGRTPSFPYTPAAGTEATFLRPLEIGSTDPGFRIGYVQQWNFGVQRPLARRMVATLSYVGAKGTALWIHGQENFAVYLPGESTVQNIQQRRPLADFGAIPSVSSAGNSSYHALQATLSRRFAQGLTLAANYTFGKSMDNVSDENAGGVETPNPKNAGLNRGRSDFDIRHRFVASFVYELPLYRGQRGLAGKLLGTWQVSGVVSAQSGRPFSVLSGGANSLSGTTGDRADVAGDPRLPAPGYWFNPDAFTMNALGTWGNSGRNTLTSPGLVNIDLGIARTFSVTERLRAQLRGELFNAPNHMNPGTPNNTVSSSLFGVITSAAPARVVQLGLKLSF